MGSVLVGKQKFMDKAMRVRKVLGGGMRQVGFAAAAGLYGIEHHWQRMADDHKRAQELSIALNQHPDVFMPTYIESLKVKEPRFLISKIVKDRLHAGVWTFDEYKKLFKEASNYKAVGEATVLYLYYYE